MAARRDRTLETWALRGELRQAMKAQTTPALACIPLQRTSNTEKIILFSCMVAGELALRTVCWAEVKDFHCQQPFSQKSITVSRRQREDPGVTQTP